MAKSTHVLLQLLQFASPLFLLCISDSPHLVSRNNKKHQCQEMKFFFDLMSRNEMF